MSILSRPAIAIVGAGKVGSALGILLQSKGYSVVGVASRTPASAEKLAERLNCPAFSLPLEAVAAAELVFITTPDRAIGQVAADIAAGGGFKPGQIVVHTSGAHPSSILRGVREAGALAVSIHPLQSFAGVETAIENLPGSYFALEGDERAMETAWQVIQDLGGRGFSLAAGAKPLYHAAACIASNYLVAIMHFATGLYGRFGLDRKEAFQALLPLVEGTVNNIGRVGPVAALTGPVARGDGATLEDHLAAFKDAGGLETDLYCRLGRYTVDVALEQGSISSEQAAELKQIFEEGLP
jgi:predicted short-subunit dehydrogenase-like oxidoreductase (DUF2520 family)